MDENKALDSLKKQMKENQDSVAKLRAKMRQLEDEKFMLKEELKRCEVQQEAVTKEKAEKSRPRDPRKKLRDADPALMDKKDPRKAKELQDLVQNQLNTLMRGKVGESDIDLGEPRIKVVRIKFLPGVKDGEIDKYERIEPLEAEFKLTQKSTFRTLKETACQFWVLSSQDLLELSKYELRAENMAILDVNPSEKVVEVLSDNGIPAELWLFEKFTKATELLPPMENYFFDQNTRMKFIKESTMQQPKQRKAHLGLTDAQHAENFKVLKRMYIGLNVGNNSDL